MVLTMTAMIFGRISKKLQEMAPEMPKLTHPAVKLQMKSVEKSRQSFVASYLRPSLMYDKVYPMDDNFLL